MNFLACHLKLLSDALQVLGIPPVCIFEVYIQTFECVYVRDRERGELKEVMKALV